MLRLPPLEFSAPTELGEALAALAGGKTRLVAGGTDLWPNMKRRHQQADAVVSLMSIDELRQVEQNSRELVLGSTVTLTALLRNDSVRERYPGFARAVAAISSPPLRNMGTLGGNLCVDTRCTYYNQTEEWRRSIDYCMKEQGAICWVATKSPRCWAHSASDTAPMLCALGARVRLVSVDGEREIPITSLYRDDGIDYLGMKPGEILTQVILPREADSEHCRSAFWKLRRRGSIDFSVLSVAVALWTDSRNVVERAAVYLGAVGSSPVAVSAAEELLVGKQLDEDLIAAVARRARKDATPMSNTDFMPSWRGKMAEHYTHAALCEVAGLPVRRLAPKHGLTVV